MRRIFTLLIYFVFFVRSSLPAGAYPQNFLSAELGARVLTKARLQSGADPNAILSDGPVSKGRIKFANVDQLQTFTVDLGREREMDCIQIGTGSLVRYIRIMVSRSSSNGPFKMVLEFKDPAFFQTLRFPLNKARWVRFDFGIGRGALVHSVRLYKEYEYPKLIAVTKLLSARIKPDIPGLKEFYSAVKRNEWATACSELRAYFASSHKPEGLPAGGYDLSRAENIANGKISFAGLDRIDPLPIDWTYMETSDWYEHKNFLNRGSPIGVLVDAYYHTGDSKWSALFSEVFYDWVDANPKPSVMSGADYPTWRTLDTAARVGWIVSRFPKVTSGGDINDELWANYLFSIWEHTDYLKNDNFSGGNWLATITSSVMYIAQQFPEFKDRRIWLAYAKDGFERNVIRDIYPDGKEMEDAPGYICMAYQGMLRTLKALDKEGIEVNPVVRKRMNKVQDFLGAVTQPDGNMPKIGDWGGGPPSVLNESLEYFKREDIRYILTKGKEGVMPSHASIHFPDGGWSIMRDPYDREHFMDAKHLVFKSSAGPHGHRDVLSITAYAYGRELLIDPGIRSYEREDVKRYKHTSYHNTICIDGQNQPNTRGKTEKWFSNSAVDYVLGTFTGYKDLVHRRSILFVKPDYWIVHDDVLGGGNHTYDLNWHYAPEAKITADPETKAVRTNYPTGGNMLIVPANHEDLSFKLFDFFVTVDRMAGSGSEAVSKGGRYRKTGSPPKTFNVVLYPYSSVKVPDILIKTLDAGSTATEAALLQVRIGNKVDYVFISHTGPRFFSVQGEDLIFHGEVGVIRTKDGKLIRAGGSSIKKIKFRNKVFLSRDKFAPECDLQFE